MTIRKKTNKAKKTETKGLAPSTVQNLIDAGCNEEFIESFARTAKNESKEKQLSLLSGHRSSLLDNVHTNQKRTTVSIT